MSRLGSATLAAMLMVGAFLAAGHVAPTAVAQTPDRSEVVLVLDFSASIVGDVANRERFAAALDRIAARIEVTTADLVAGDATVTIVQFATRAADYPGCVGLRLLDSPQAVTQLAGCLRSVAAAYRAGPTPALTQQIGIDTNYVAAMEQAAAHLPVDAVRPALILFTDGKHDVAGVPIDQVQPARDRLFGTRTPFALLPVGMGLLPTERDALESGLISLRITRDMPACVSGTRFDWPQVVFDSAEDAGAAVAVALQNVTCTFTVAPTPSPTPAPTPAGVSGVVLTPGDGRIEVAWTAPADSPVPIVDYRVRCRSGEGDWTESAEGTSLETSAVVEGLVNGVAYMCEVASVGAGSEGPWEGAAATVTPLGRPAAPGKPIVEPLDRAVRIQLPTESSGLVSGYRYECSSDQGGTWPIQVDVAASGIAATEIGNLTNGVEYVCRAFAANAVGASEPSIVSDAVRPCGSLIECNPIAALALGGLVVLASVGILAALFMLYRERRRGYVVAVVDVLHSANLGNKSRMGIGFVRSGPRGPVTGIVADSSKRAELRVRHLGGDRFEVVDRAGRSIALSGERVITIDSFGVRHEVVLHRFRTASASLVSRKA